MARDPKGVPVDALDAIRQELARLNERLRRVENNTIPTMQQISIDDILDPLEGEYVIDHRDHQHTWYSGGEWRRPESARQLLRTITTGGVSSSATVAGTTYAHLIQNIPIFEGDGLLVFAIAPQYPSGGAPAGAAISCTDSAGNNYVHLTSMSHQIDPATPTVDTGYRVEVFWCEQSQAVMPLGTSTITVTWDNPVSTRTIAAFSVTQFGGNRTPLLLGKTADHDPGAYATTILSQSGSFTPSRSRAMMFALSLLARPVPDSGVAQFTSSGFNFMGAVGSQNWTSQVLNHFTTVYGADVVQTVEATTYHYALGFLPPAVPTGTKTATWGYRLDGVAVPNRWKSIIILGFT